MVCILCGLKPCSDNLDEISVCDGCTDEVAQVTGVGY